MHERMELKTNKLAVLLTAAWPMVLALLGMAGLMLVLLPAGYVLLVAAMMLFIALLTLLICVPMYMGVYLFLPPTEYKGARLLARLGRHATETEISAVSRSEIMVKQNFIEKAFKVCHIRVKGTMIYLRGVPEMDKVTAWLDANFPEKTAVMRFHEEKARKGKKGKKSK